MNCITLAFRAALAALLSVAAFGLAPAAQAQQIAGVVADCAGAPIGGASVDVYRVDGTDEEGAETLVASGSTNGAGVFGFTGFPRGTYYVVVTCTCGRVFITEPLNHPGTLLRVLRFKCCHCGRCQSASSGGGQVYSYRRPGGPRAPIFGTHPNPPIILPPKGRWNPPPCRGPRGHAHRDLRGWPRVGWGR